MVKCLTQDQGEAVRASPASLCCVLEQNALILNLKKISVKETNYFLVINTKDMGEFIEQPLNGLRLYKFLPVLMMKDNLIKTKL